MAPVCTPDAKAGSRVSQLLATLSLRTPWAKPSDSTASASRAEMKRVGRVTDQPPAFQPLEGCGRLYHGSAGAARSVKGRWGAERSSSRGGLYRQGGGSGGNPSSSTYHEIPDLAS